MTARLGTAALTLVLAAVFGLAGCSSDAGSKEGSGSSSAAPGETSGDFEKVADESVCKADVQDKALEAPYGEGFPQDWPFPPDTIVYNVEIRADTGVIVTAVSSTPFQEILDFMNGDVVAAGFEIESGETEDNDAEAEWKSTDYSGRWAIRTSATCDGETIIQVFAAQE